MKVGCERESESGVRESEREREWGKREWGERERAEKERVGGESKSG